MPWGAVIGAVGAIGGAAISSSSARSAARDQNRAVDSSNELQRWMFDQNRRDQEPWRQAGVSGLTRLQRGLGIRQTPQQQTAQVQAAFDPQRYLDANPDVAEWVTRDTVRRDISDDPLEAARQHYERWGRNEGAQGRPSGQLPQQQQPGDTFSGDEQDFGDLIRDFRDSDYREDPGYRFRLREGETAVNRNALARGRYDSGSTLKALQKFNSDLASQEFGNAYNRFRQGQGDRFNRFASLAGVGQTATQQIGNDRSEMTSRVGDNIIGGGNSRAAARVGTGNAISNGVGQAMNFWQNQQYTNALRGNRPPPRYTPEPSAYYGGPGE